MASCEAIHLKPQHCMKKMKSTLDKLLAPLLRQRADYGEDFWVFSIVTDDPNNPSWEQRYSIIGTYGQNVMACAALINGIAGVGLPKAGIRIESYQGEGARRYLAHAGQQEREYQQHLGRPLATN